MNKLIEALNKIICEAVGAASLCWDPKPTGVFDSSEASRVCEDALNRIKALASIPEISPTEARAALDDLEYGVPDSTFWKRHMKTVVAALGGPVEKAALSQPAPVDDGAVLSAAKRLKRHMSGEKIDTAYTYESDVLLLIAAAARPQAIDGEVVEKIKINIAAAELTVQAYEQDGNRASYMRGQLKAWQEALALLNGGGRERT